MQVKLGGTWFQVDCTFGSGSVVNKKEFKHDFSRLYFAPPPEQLILTHWPGGDNKWQLLQQPIEVHELKPLIVPKLKVLAQGIQPEMVTQVIHVPQNNCLPIVTIPLKASQNLKFRATIKPLDSPSNLHKQTNDANQLTYVERDGENVRVHTIIPGKGKFSLDISVAEQMESTYTTSLSYYVQSDFRPQEPQYCGYPQIHQTNSNFHLLSCNTQDKVAHTCKCEGGELKLTFTADHNAKIQHYIIPGRSGQSEALWCYTEISKDESNPSLQTLRVVFPSPGWWRVELADDHVIMSYQVCAERGKTNVLFPNVLPNEANIELVPTSVVGFQDDGNPFVLQFHALPGFQFSHKICLHSSNDHKIEAVKNCSNVSRSSTTPNLFTLQATFPRAGKWAVNLYAGKPDVERFPLVIQVKYLDIANPQPDLQFPTVYQKFDEMGFSFTYVRRLQIPTKLVTIPTVIRTPLCVPDGVETLPEATIKGVTICTATKVHCTSARGQELQATIDRRGVWTVKLSARSIQAYCNTYHYVMKYTVEAL